MRTIHTLLERGECEPPTFLKIDVEGSEADVLRGAGDCLRRPDLALIVSLHSAQQYEACLAILKKHVLEEPPAPSRVRPGVPPELDALVLHLLRKTPAERPAGAEALVIALRDFLRRAA